MGVRKHLSKNFQLLLSFLVILHEKAFFCSVKTELFGLEKGLLPAGLDGTVSVCSSIRTFDRWQKFGCRLGWVRFCKIRPNYAWMEGYRNIQHTILLLGTISIPRLLEGNLVNIRNRCFVFQNRINRKNRSVNIHISQFLRIAQKKTFGVFTENSTETEIFGSDWGRALLQATLEYRSHFYVVEFEKLLKKRPEKIEAAASNTVCTVFGTLR